MNQWTEDNVIQRKIINKRAHSDHTRGNIVQRQSWSKWTLEAIENKDVPERHLHIDIWVYSLKHGNDSWKMLLHSCFWMNIRRMHTTKTDGETKMYLKDIYISSSFKTWLSTNEDTWINVIEWREDTHHQDWLWNNAALEG